MKGLLVFLLVLSMILGVGCAEKVTEPIVTEPEPEEVEEVVEEIVEPPAEGVVGLLKEDPLLAFVGKTKEDVLQHFDEEPEIFEPDPGQTVPMSILNYDGFSFSCLADFVVSVSRTEDDFLGITLGKNYDESQITEILGIPAEEGSWDFEGDEVRYLIFWVEDYQLIFYLEDTLSVQYGIGQF